jgi:hypothetical protein
MISQPEFKELKKRFYVFELCSYYPAGGMNDVVLFCNTKEEYEAFILERDSLEMWYEILDTHTGVYFAYEE